ncbi:unnamed protein product [Trichobilharzia regenti]|nr:unnamed protein product [Trichobilharzia regenti]
MHYRGVLNFIGIQALLCVFIQVQVIFGRSSLFYQPYIDLSYEGDSARVSRCHGQIRLDNDGIFWLANFSSHAVYVDGNPILTGE